MTEFDRINAVQQSIEEEARIDEALRYAQDPPDDAVAVSARYDPGTDMLVLQLKTGQRIAIPREDLQGLSDASPTQLSDIEILEPGTAVHWDSLMEGFEVDDLRNGIYGSRRWMDSLAEHRKSGLPRAS